MSTGSDVPWSGAPPPPAGLLDTLRVGVVLLDTRGRIALWSQLAEEILGWRARDVIGRPVDLVLATDDRHPRMVPAAVLRDLRQDGRWTGRLPLRRRDGRTVTAEVRASVLTDRGDRGYVLISLADTMLLRGVEHDLAILDAVFDTSSAGIAIFDTDLRYVRVNGVFAAMNRRKPADHLGRTVEDIVPGEVGRELAAVQRQVLETGRTVVDLLTPGAGGVGFRSASFSRITDRRGQVLGISCVVTDVTERMLASVKVERARGRLSVLSDVGGVLSDLMELDRLAQALADVLVPVYCDHAALLLVQHVVDGGELPTEPLPPGTPLVLAGTAGVPGHTLERPDGPGRPTRLPAGSPLTGVLAGGPAWFADSPADIRAAYGEPLDDRVRAALDLGVGSVMAAPLRAQGAVLGLLVLGRSAARERFDADDLALASELADRAGAGLDNARLYARERQGTLMLQRALLPQTVPELTGVEVAHRYVPGSSGAEAGGDWFDVVPLAGGRVAFVIGDVMGHGLPAAATMGRLRTAVRTLAGLDLAPDEMLHRLDDLSDDFALSPEEPMMATCAYAVYDPSSRRCVLACAGHLPPLLVLPGEDGRPAGVRRLELPPNTPIGIGGDHFEAAEFTVPEGAVLALYTDGLIERRGEDITDGIGRLSDILCRPYGSLEDACDGILAGLTPDREPDDVAVLVARLGGLPAGSSAAWTFPAEPAAAGEARARVRHTLAAWGLRPLTDVTVLLVSELVTNSLRHAHGPIGVRMVRGPSLLVEVSDPLTDPPRTRAAADTDEGGRGMHLVARSSRRWGTRFGPFGKTVWFELALPDG